MAGVRTPDLEHQKRTLYPLRYAPPGTAKCNSQLLFSYQKAFFVTPQRPQLPENMIQAVTYVKASFVKIRPAMQEKIDDIHSIELVIQSHADFRVVRWQVWGRD